MPGQMPEEIVAQQPGDAHESAARDEARHAPQQIVRGDEGEQQCKGDPGGTMIRLRLRQRVDEEFYAILRANRAPDRRDNRRQNDRVLNRAAADVARHEAKRPMGILARSSTPSPSALRMEDAGNATAVCQSFTRS